MSKPNEKRFKAQTLWQKGLSYEKISKRLDIPEGTLRRWKSTYKWERPDDPNTRTEETETKKRGGQKGNVNSVGNGGGAPIGNTNSQTHGGYSSISLDFLTEEEREFIEKEQERSERNMLLEEVALQKIRERRVFMYIEKFKSEKPGTKGNFEALVKAEDALTRIQSAMSKSIQTLHQMGIDDRMIALREKELEAKLAGKNPADGKKGDGKLKSIMEQLKR